MGKKISEIITTEVIERDWKMGMKILIRSQTGTGKSYWAQNVLYDYCKKNNYKCLFFSNRTVLKEQNEKLLKGKEDVFDIANYQNVSEKIYGGIPLSEIYNKYDVIILDEAHFFLEDAPYNRKTDLLLKSLKYPYPEKLLVLLTATPQMLLTYKPSYDKVYDLENDYSYISKFLFYRNNLSIDKIVRNLPDDKKILYFARKAEDAYDLKKRFLDDSSFVCSPDKKSYGKLSDKAMLKRLSDGKGFDTKLLCSTKLLDTGINIDDESLKVIVIDSTDPINIIQSIGRKRVRNSEDTIEVYIRNVNKNDMIGRMNECKKNLDMANELKKIGKEEFQLKYKKNRLPEIIDNDTTVNIAIEIYYRYMLKFYESMEYLDSNFRNYFYSYFQYTPNEQEFVEHELQKPDLIRVLEENKDIKFFEEDQLGISKKLFSVILSSGVSNDRNMGFNVISKIIKRANLPFTVSSIQETKGQNRNKRYWMFKSKIEGGNNENN